MPDYTDKQLDSVLKRALMLSDEDREAFLDETCGRDTDFRRYINRLLHAGEADDSLLGTGGGMSGPVWEALKGKRRSAYELNAGEEIGVYRIVRRIGIGGMATVYLAERIDGEIEQQVAVKVLDTQNIDETEQRFRQERQILASLDHPYIARLLDAGLSSNGQPYVAMEYVDGQSIDAYCDGKRLNLRARLELFQKVAEAVQYAHGSLIIHRDIKPSNILVTNDSIPKLLDFGIAKLLDPTLPFAAPETRGALNPMTPDYASPEQVRGQPLTVATDVYQLGFLLYRLLAGCHPYQFDRRDYVQLLDAICNHDPLPPSETVNGAVHTAEELTTICAARRTTSRRMIRQLNGDLDNICLLALRKEPTRRYGSAGLMAEDIDSYRSHLPIRAGRDAFSYRFRKFVSRYAVGCLVSLLAFVAVLAVFFYHTDRIAEESQQTRIEAEKSEQVASFLINLFQVSDPTISRDKLTARELLDAGAERVGEELVSQPLVQASLLRTIAQAYQNLGFYEDAEKLVSRSIQTYETELGPTHEETLRARILLGSHYLWQDRNKDAEVLYRHLLEQLENTLGPLDPKTVAALNNLGLSVLHQGRHAEAESIFIDVITRRRAISDDDPKMVGSLNNLGNVYAMQGRNAKAAEYHQQAVELGRETLGRDHPSTMNALNNLGMDYRPLGQLELAEKELREVIELRSRVLGREHARTLSSQTGLVDVLTDVGNYAEARQLLVPTIETTKRVLGPEHSSTLRARERLARLEMRVGNYSAAEAIRREILSTSTSMQGELHYETLLWTSALGEALEAQGKIAEAESHYAKGYEGFRQSQSDDFTYTVRAQVLLGALLTGVGRTAEADTLLSDAVAVVEKPEFGDLGVQARAYQAYGDLLTQQGLLADAERYLAKAYDAYERRYSSDHTETTAVQTKLVSLRQKISVD